VTAAPSVVMMLTVLNADLSCREDMILLCLMNARSINNKLYINVRVV
jgi:hypothetical protein